MLSFKKKVSTNLCHLDSDQDMELITLPTGGIDIFGCDRNKEFSHVGSKYRSSYKPSFQGPKLFAVNLICSGTV